MSNTRWIKHAALLVAVLAIAAVLWAASQGPNNPGTMANIAGAQTDWANPDNAKVSDDSYMSAALAKNGYSDYFSASNLGFTIPTGATIDGIACDTEVSSTGAGTVKFDQVYTYKGNTLAGTSQRNATTWTSTDTYLTHGGTTNKWGTTWTAAEINNSNFNLRGNAHEQNVNTATAQIDHIRVTVYYTPAPSTGRKAFIINIGSLLPAWSPEPCAWAGLPLSETREGEFGKL